MGSTRLALHAGTAHSTRTCPRAGAPIARVLPQVVHAGLTLAAQPAGGLGGHGRGFDGPASQAEALHLLVERRREQSQLLGSLTLVAQFNAAEKDACYLAVAAGRVVGGAGIHPKPTVWIDGGGAVLVDVLRAKTDITHPLSRGEVTIKGDYYHAIDLSRVALAVRRG